VKEKTQSKKHAKKREHYLNQDEVLRNIDDSSATSDDKNEEPILHYDAYRAFWACLSKITKQVWRFLKNCYQQKSSPGFYNRQLKPMLEKYL
jgi:hypothetical protein